MQKVSPMFRPVVTILFGCGLVAACVSRQQINDVPMSKQRIVPKIALFGNVGSPDVDRFEIDLLGCRSGNRGTSIYSWVAGAAVIVPPSRPLELRVGDIDCYLQLRVINFKGRRYTNLTDRREVIGDVKYFEMAGSHESVLRVEVIDTIPITAITTAAVNINYTISETAYRAEFEERIPPQTLVVQANGLLGLAPDANTWQINATCNGVPTVVTHGATFSNSNLSGCTFALTQISVGGNIYTLDAALTAANGGTPTLISGTRPIPLNAQVRFTPPNNLAIEVFEVRAQVNHTLASLLETTPDEEERKIDFAEIARYIFDLDLLPNCRPTNTAATAHSDCADDFKNDMERLARSTGILLDSNRFEPDWVEKSLGVAALLRNMDAGKGLVVGAEQPGFLANIKSSSRKSLLLIEFIHNYLKSPDITKLPPSNIP